MMNNNSGVFITTETQNPVRRHIAELLISTSYVSNHDVHKNLHLVPQPDPRTSEPSSSNVDPPGYLHPETRRSPHRPGNGTHKHSFSLFWSILRVDRETYPGIPVRSDWRLGPCGSPGVLKSTKLRPGTSLQQSSVYQSCDPDPAKGARSSAVLGDSMGNSMSSAVFDSSRQVLCNSTRGSVEQETLKGPTFMS